MPSINMPIVAVDLGSAQVSLACWDGRDLRVCKAPVGAPPSDWPAWIARLKPSQPHEVVFRCHAACPTDDVIAALGASHGASRVRIIPRGAADDPALAHLRALMPRLRLGVLSFLEVGARCWQCGVLDRRGRLVSHRAGELAACGAGTGSSHPEAALAEAMRACIVGAKESYASDAPPNWLAAFGGNGPMHAAEVAASCGLSRVLVPDHAAALGAVGMLTQDRVLEFRETIPPQPPDVAALRYAFARLMDEAARAVTMEGFDIDDTVCERFAVLGPCASGTKLVVSCETLTDADALIKRYRREHSRRNGCDTPSAVVQLHAAGLRVTVQAERPALPSMTWRSLPEDDSSIFGPAELREDDMTIIVPESWHARSSPTGGMMLERRP